MTRSGNTRRLKALEGNTTTDECGIVRIPKDWSTERRQQAVEAFKTEYGLPSSAPVDVTESSIATDLEPIFAGNIREWIDYIRKHGSRVGD
jgi:hypothetical protein